MSHYKPYPTYKESGVEWIGPLPGHWVTPALKFLVSTPITDGPHETPNPDISGDGVLFISAEAVSSGVIDFNKAWGYISRADHDRYSQKYRPAINDIYMVKSGATTGITAIVEDDREFNIWSPLAAIRSGKKVSPRFLLNALRATSFQDGVVLNWSYGTQQNIGMKVLETLPVPLPPSPEQEQIVKVLDRETARIDALITKKTTFIKLLAKKRQALITHAVTKGLNPEVKMKDSGEKWLGHIPEHWEFVPSNSLFPESKDRAWAEDEHLSATQKYGVIPLAEYERLEARQVTHAVKNLDQRKHAEIDDFVISMRSFEGGIERVKARGCVRSSYVVLKAGDKAHAGFFTYLFKSSAYIQGLQATATFIRDGQDLSYSNFRQVKLPRPGLDEQKAIADFLDKSVSRIDLLTEKTQLSINLLKKRRSALITAAVTGQIDLRESA